MIEVFFCPSKFYNNFMALNTSVSFFKSALFLISLTFIISSCSVYRSTGRKSFETKASQNNVTTSAAPLHAEDLDAEDLCWTQPSNEPIWNLEHTNSNENSLIVTKLNQEEIQVCAQ